MRPIPLLLAGLCPCVSHAAPRLHLSHSTLAPDSSVEVVLDRPAANDDAIGRPVEGPWLKIEPSWRGSWRWKDANIAEFLPSEPPLLGTTYTFSLPEGLTHLDGTEIPAGPFASPTTESFGIQHASLLHRYEPDWSPRTATYFLRFNGDVDAPQAAPFLFFEAEGNLRVAANTQTATFGHLKHRGYLGLSWEERFARRGQNDPLPEPAAETAFANGLLVTPVSPLPVGKHWRLTILAGLPHAHGAGRLSEDTVQHIATIDPLQLTSLQARTVADQPRRIVASFNLPMARAIDPSWVTITPQPADFRAEVHGSQLHLLGDFSTVSDWHVTLSPAVTSQDGRALGNAVRKTVTFRPLPPGLALPSKDEAQLAAGSRQYRIQTVNLASLTLRIKRLDGPQLLRAQQGFRHYTGTGPDGKSLRTTHPIPFELILGEPLAELEIPLENPLDTSETLVLDWDKVLAKDPQPYSLSTADTPAAPAHAGPPAAFFVELVGTPKEGSVRPGEQSPLSQALVQLTDIGLAWKLVGDSAQLFAFSLRTGQPLPDVSLQLAGEDARPLHQAKSDALGLASLPREPQARHLQANLGEDRYTVAYDASLATERMWQFPVRYSWYDAPLEKRRVFLFTDRSLYRPGETVHLKGLVRRQHGNEITSQPAAPNRLTVTDPTSRELLRREIEVSADGSFDLSFPLPAGKTGHHRITFEYPEELSQAEERESWYERSQITANARFTLGLRVEEFRRNAFEISSEPEPPAPGAGNVAFALQASYFHGQPVAQGTVSYYSSLRETNFYPDRYRDFLFGDHRRPDFDYWDHYFGYHWHAGSASRSVTQAHGNATLAADGTARIVIDAPANEFPATRQAVLSSEITDANQQTLTAYSETTLHPAAVYVGVQRLDRLIRVGDKIPLRLIAVAPEGKPFACDLTVTARLSREVNDQVRLSDGNGNSAVRNEARREELSSTTLELQGGNASWEFAPDKVGLHQLELRGTDAEGRPFATAISLHVYGGNEYPWAYENGMRIQLVAEKPQYQPGETARVLVLSPIEGTALVTVERENVLRSFPVALKADQPVIEIPLSDGDAPNVFVSVLVIKGAQDSARSHKEPQLRLGYCELMVANRQDKLHLTLASSGAQQEGPTAANTPVSYLPGEEITVSGAVRLANGDPAAGAEITLWAEDEGTLSVMGYKTPDPLAFFYDPRDLRVKTGTSLGDFLSESPDDQTFYNKGFFVGDGGDGDDPLAAPPRKDFNPCAVWLPTLRTDAQGRYRATFRLPDTLTRYRLIAVGHHGAARFGGTESTLVVNKPLMIEPQAPRFASEGDQLSVRTLVQNASPYRGTWTIRFTPSPASSPSLAELVDAAPDRTVSLAPGESATLVYPVRFTDTGEAVFHWSATPVSIEAPENVRILPERFADSVEIRFPVHYPVPLLRQSKLVSLGSSSSDLLQHLDPALLQGRGHLEIELSRSLLMEAAGSVDYLLQYPYGCVEQTTSSLMPWLAVEQLRGISPALARHTPAQVREAIQRGADRLLSMQLPNGGFSYWPATQDVVPWASGYAGLGLLLSQKAGAAVPDAAIGSLCQHLETGLRGAASTQSSAELENACRALLVLAYADRQPHSYISVLHRRLADLTPRARALLALAAHTAGSGIRGEDILRDATPFRGKDDSWMRYEADHALRLLAWSRIAPNSAESHNALEALLQQRNPYGHWRTTWLNGWSLLALSAYAEHQHDSTPARITLVTAEGPRTVILHPGDPAVSLEFPLAETLRLSAHSDVPVPVRLNLAAKPEIAPIQPVAANGLEITRSYERMKPDGTSEPLAHAKLGDLVRITLRIELPQDDHRYLAIEDRLPSLFEAVHSDFASQAAVRGGPTSERNWSISHSELRSDRACFFLDRVWRKGHYEITYLTRCTMEGKAIAPAAKVESMYDPDQTALSASREF